MVGSYSTITYMNVFIEKDEHFVWPESCIILKSAYLIWSPSGINTRPLLFITHMNDLPLRLNELHIDLFADDGTQYSSHVTRFNPVPSVSLYYVYIFICHLYQFKYYYCNYFLCFSFLSLI